MRKSFVIAGRKLGRFSRCSTTVHCWEALTISVGEDLSTGVSCQKATRPFPPSRRGSWCIRRSGGSANHRGVLGRAAVDAQTPTVGAFDATIAMKAKEQE